MGPSHCYSQSRFNIITDCGHPTMNVLVSVLPLHDGYLLTVGTGNVEGYGDNRCTMLVKTDLEGNVLYRNFICDSTYDVYEGRVSSGLIEPTPHMTYKCMLECHWNKMICCEFDDSLGCIYRQDTFFDIPHTIGDAHYCDNGIYIVGQIHDNNKYCGYIEKRDSLGVLSNRIIPYGYNVESAYDAVIRNNEGYLLAYGIVATNINNHLYSLVKLDTSLNIIWQKTYGRANWNNGEQSFIAPSPDSCYVMSGIYPVCYADRYEYETCDAACIRKIDDNGNLLWEKVIKNYGPSPLFYLNDESYDLYVDDNGYIYVASTIMYNNFSRTGALTKLSPQGDIMYIRHYEPTGRGEHQSAITYLNSVKPTPDGGLIMGGYTYDSYYTAAEFGDYFQQPWLVKTDMDGLDGLCYTELPELTLDVFIPDTVCNLDTIDCVVNISGPSAPYRLDFSTGQVIDSIYYPDTYVPYDFGIDRPISSEYLYEYSDYITEATLKKNTTWEDIIARHYNIRTPRDPGEHQLAITLSDYYGNTKTIYKDIYVNPCHDLAVDENDNIMLSVYPNPATEYINIAGENIARIEICNLLGEVVYYIGNVAPRHDTTNVISTENMPAGSYFVRVRMADGKVVTKKIIVL